MKKIIFIALMATALALFSCAESTDGKTEDICLSVLDNSKKLYDPETKAEIYLSDYAAKRNMSLSEYAVIDLDGDSLPEIVVGLARDGYDDGYVILHADKGTAYAYELPYRALTNLKEDGTFSFSSGAADNGIGRLEFSDGGYSVEKLAYSESGDDIQDVSYHIDGADATEDEFYALIDEQNKKPGAAWQKISAESKLSD